MRAAAAVAVMAGAFSFWLAERVSERRASDALAAADGALSSARHDLRTVAAAAAAVSAQQQQVLTSVHGVLTTTASVQQQVARGEPLAYYGAVRVNGFSGCLSGIQQTFLRIASNNLPQAVGAMSAALPDCVLAEGGPADGLSYPFDFPDPSLLRAGNEYYAYATNSVAGNIQVIESPDLVDWTVVGDALPKLPTWASPGATWAPGVVQVGSKYLMYFSTIQTAGSKECITVAESPNPTGPFVDSATQPLTCAGPDGSTDPDPFTDGAGHLFLAWATVSNGNGSAAIWSQALASGGTALAAGGATLLLAPDEAWEGGPTGVVEGPSLFFAGGRYYLLYSGNDWRTAGYAIGLATCSGPTGPCQRASSQPFLASGEGYVGPGGPAVVTDGSGNLWLAFHAWLPGDVGYPYSRPLFIRHLELSPDGQLTVGPPAKTSL